MSGVRVGTGGGKEEARGRRAILSLRVYECEWVCRVQEDSSAAARVMSDTQVLQRLEFAVGGCARAAGNAAARERLVVCSRGGDTGAP